MSEEAGSWGGARKGAGRPTVQNKAETGSIRMTRDLWDKADALAEAAGMSRSAWMADKVKRARK